MFILTLTKIVFFLSIVTSSDTAFESGLDWSCTEVTTSKCHLTLLYENIWLKTTLLNSYAQSRASQSCHIITGNDYFVSVSGSVVDPDPYSGALWIRIRIPDTDQEKIYNLETH